MPLCSAASRSAADSPRDFYSVTAGTDTHVFSQSCTRDYVLTSTKEEISLCR